MRSCRLPFFIAPCAFGLAWSGNPSRADSLRSPACLGALDALHSREATLASTRVLDPGLLALRRRAAARCGGVPRGARRRAGRAGASGAAAGVDQRFAEGAGRGRASLADADALSAAISRRAHGAAHHAQLRCRRLHCQRRLAAEPDGAEPVGSGRRVHRARPRLAVPVTAAVQPCKRLCRGTLASRNSIWSTRMRRPRRIMSSCRLGT